ncbi:MAG: hypothetical protein ACO3P3_07055, partial [Candidatus Nanopelagicales bacterium]
MKYTVSILALALTTVNAATIKAFAPTPSDTTGVGTPFPSIVTREPTRRPRTPEPTNSYTTFVPSFLVTPFRTVELPTPGLGAFTPTPSAFTPFPSDISTTAYPSTEIPSTDSPTSAAPSTEMPSDSPSTSPSKNPSVSPSQSPSASPTFCEDDWIYEYRELTWSNYKGNVPFNPKQDAETATGLTYDYSTIIQQVPPPNPTAKAIKAVKRQIKWQATLA